MQVAYGHQITSNEDPYLQITEDIGHALSNAGSPGNTPVDFFPFRKRLLIYRFVRPLNMMFSIKYLPSWFPGASYAGFARNQKGAIRKLHDYPFYNVKAQLVCSQVEV